MLHFGSFEIRTELFILMIAALLLCIQIFLCWHIKNRKIHVIPSVFCLTTAAVFTAIGLLFDGWDRFAFLFLAGCSAVLAIVCAIGIGIWNIIQKINIRKG